MFLILYILKSLICISLINSYPQPFECECLNEGLCVGMPSGEIGCSCQNGFYGKKCENIEDSETQILLNDDDDNELASFGKIKCHNNGSIYFDKNNRLRCKCNAFTTGAKCEFVLPLTSSCAPNPCYNGGLCADLNPGFKCTCPPAYTGIHCEVTISFGLSTTTTTSSSNCFKQCDPCRNNPCSIHSQCFNQSCNPICICNSGYTGTLCNILISSSSSSTTTTPCSVSATTTPCSVSTTTPSTTTPCSSTTTTAQACHFVTPTTTTQSSPCNYPSQCNPCQVNPCNQNGQCYNYSCTAYCECNVGFTGTYCDTKITDPNSNPVCNNPCNSTATCSNNGECFSLQCEAYCVCNLGYTGIHCEAPLVPSVSTTTSLPFSNCGQCLNGQCRNISNCQYYCECNPGYTGTFCDVLLPTMPISTTPIPSVVNTMQISPRCNFSIGLYNDGAFTTRFIVEYKIEGVVQPLLKSASLAIIGQSTFNTIPYYSTDISVTIEVLGWSWFTAKVDTGISTSTYCTKCYKTWGTVTGVNVDYIKC